MFMFTFLRILIWQIIDIRITPYVYSNSNVFQRTRLTDELTTTSEESGAVGTFLVVDKREISIDNYSHPYPYVYKY